MSKHAFKVGQRVIVNHNLDETDRRHTVVTLMREMIGKVYKISNISGEKAYLNGYMFYTGDLRPLKDPPEPIGPVTFDPEKLISI